MIGTLRRHQQWLWMIIITITIISFVIFFSPNTKMGWKTSRENYKYVNGKPVTINGQPIMNDEYVLAYRETVLASMMRTGKFPDNDENTQKRLEQDAIFRIFVLKKAKEQDIHVSDAEVARVARERYLGNTPLSKLEQEWLLPHGLSEEDFERYLRNDLIIQQLIDSAAITAKLYSPKEGEALYRKQNEQNDARLAVFWASNYLSKVTVSSQDLSNYYTMHMSEYRVPDRVVVNYVEFPATNFLAEADKQIEKRTNFTADIENYYFKRGTNYWKDTNGNVIAEADAKKKIKEDFRTEFALLEARRKASEFGTALYNAEATNLTKQATNLGLVVKTSPPLERSLLSDEDEEKNSEFSRDFRERAFKLTADAPVSFTPILGDKAVYVIALKERLKSQFQPMDQVKDKLTTDYKNSKAIELARADGANFYKVLTNGLANKESFEAICTRARIPFITPPRFSTASTSKTVTNLDERISLQTLQTLAIKLKPGQVSEYSPTDPTRSPEGRYLPPQGGFIFYLKEKIPVDDATVKKELPDYLAKMRSYRQNEVFNQWFRKQVEQSKLYIAPARETTGITQGG